MELKEGTVVRRLRYPENPQSKNAWIEPGQLAVVTGWDRFYERWHATVFADPTREAMVQSSMIGRYWEIVNDANF